jgi:YkoY family integral membrane protein
LFEIHGLTGLLSVSFWGGQTFVPADIAVIGLLIVMEGILSIDNALVLGLLAKRLPAHQRNRALFYGLVGAFFFRFVAITSASFLLQWTVVKVLGGGYLVYIAVRHLFFESQETEDEKIVFDAAGNPVIVHADTGQALTLQEEDLEIEQRVPVHIPQSASISEGTPGRTGTASFWKTVFVIELTDVAFAVDSILAAIALVGPPPKGASGLAEVHPKLWVVILGGLLGVILMRFAASYFIRLLERFPRFEMAAYLLVIVIGMKLLADYGANSDWNSWGWDSPQTAVAYEYWLQDHWPLAKQVEEQSASAHAPHLLDFHDWRRPEFMTFWLLMLISFFVGFLPASKGSAKSGEN